MSGPSTASESSTETNMLSISMAPPAPHFLSRVDPANSLSILSTKNLCGLGPMTPSKRPKLSLKTSDLAPTYSGSISSSRNAANTDATATPTTLNTFNNAFDLTYRSSPSSAAPSPGALLQRRVTGHTSSPISKPGEWPYSLNLPFGVQPILKNSPLPRYTRRPSTCSASESPRIASRRVFFPAPKKVTFRPVLEDVITTKDYVMRHADLSSSEDEATSSDAEGDSETVSKEGEEEVRDKGIRVDECPPRGRRKRKSMTIPDISTREVERGRDERSRSTSSRRTKRKKRRWEWTIDTVENTQDASPAAADDGNEDRKPVEGDEPELQRKTEDESSPKWHQAD